MFSPFQENTMLEQIILADNHQAKGQTPSLGHSPHIYMFIHTCKHTYIVRLGSGPTLESIEWLAWSGYSFGKLQGGQGFCVLRFFGRQKLSA